jgi:tetratricopeptide (TPR) repeat protein
MTRNAALVLVVAAATLAATGCDSLEARSKIRKGNEAYRETRFKAALGDYELAMQKLDDPVLRYNLGLDESKVFKPGTDEPIILGQADSPQCKLTPKVTPLSKSVCVKEDDERFDECDDKHVCASSYACEKVDLCQIAPKDVAGDHADDAEIRALMTQVWIDSSQYQKAIDYWQGMLDKKPKDPEIMGNLAGINLKAGDWRKSIDWYVKVADSATDPSAKIGAFQFIGNVGWAKLNSRSLTAADSIELADKSLAALANASALSPKNPRFPGLMASIYNFRSMAQGASFAASIDRATAQELQHASHVLSDEAKKAQGQVETPSAPAPTPAPPAGSDKTGG